MRTEHRTNAAEQAAVATMNMLGRPVPYMPVPFFWSDQYNVKIQVHGTMPPGSEARELYGKASEDSSFVIGYFEGERLTGVLSWNAFKPARDWIPKIKADWPL